MQDNNKTAFGLSPVTIDELIMLIAEQEDARREEDSRRAEEEAEVGPPVEAEATPGMVTCLESAAVRGVDAVEFAADPINRYNVARGVIKLMAWAARKLRG